MTAINRLPKPLEEFSEEEITEFLQGKVIRIHYAVPEYEPEALIGTLLRVRVWNPNAALYSGTAEFTVLKSNRERETYYFHVPARGPQNWHLDIFGWLDCGITHEEV